MGGAPGAGKAALAHSERIRPGESRPSSVVRSMQRIAKSIAERFASFLIERLAKLAARLSSITASTVGDGGKISNVGMVTDLRARRSPAPAPTAGGS